MEEKLEYYIDDEYIHGTHSLRLDQFLVSKNIGLSRSYLKKLIKEGNVKVNQMVQNKAAFPVEAGMNITIRIPEAVLPEIVPEKMDLDIIYEDKDIILINKPKGMVVHPASGHYSHTLVNGLMYHCGSELSGINGELRPGIVHRIDKDTTGVIVACKNDIAHRSISAQLAEHSINRKYQAIVHNNFIEETGTIEGPIGRHPIDRKKMAINPEHGKHAITHYSVLSHLNGHYNHVECVLETGRTHQIRVHMASISHPLLGDTTYGPKKPPIPNLQGQTLHAGTLGFIHPTSKKYVEFNAPLPEYFEKLLLKLS
ncbi:MAG: RluA family pseudouridine synthase [Lachnospiraceae bacterium]|nr:RluA family pseudouridine synthase [Lachnospiraceae bacterium]